MKSMTAYAQESFSTPSLRFSLELKSYNNRYLDVYVALPQALSAMEPTIRAFLQSRIGRGKVECSLRVREYLAQGSVRVDRGAAAAALSALTELADMIGPGTGVELRDLLSVEGVLGFEREVDAHELWPEVQPALEKVYAAFDAEKSREGASLLADMRVQLDRIRQGTAAIAEAAPQLEAMLAENLRKRLREAVGAGMDENRRLPETAIARPRFTVNEELTRLQSHIQAMEMELDGRQGSGKRIDFLCQEMNREVNTIGSKNQMAATGAWIVALKEALENIREQARNVE